MPHAWPAAAGHGASSSVIVAVAEPSPIEPSTADDSPTAIVSAGSGERVTFDGDGHGLGGLRRRERDRARRGDVVRGRRAVPSAVANPTLTCCGLGALSVSVSVTVLAAPVPSDTAASAIEIAGPSSSSMVPVGRPVVDRRADGAREVDGKGLVRLVQGVVEDRHADLLGRVAGPNVTVPDPPSKSSPACALPAAVVYSTVTG